MHQEVLFMIHRPAGHLISFALVLFPLALSVPPAAVTQADGDFVAKPTWERVELDSVSSQLDEYLESADVDASVKTEVRELWRSSEDTSDVLDRLAACLAKADDRVVELVDYCTGVSKPGAVPEFSWLANSDTAVLV